MTFTRKFQFSKTAKKMNHIQDILNLKRITFLFFVLLNIPSVSNLHADYYETDLIREQSQIRQIEDRQKEEERGYQYDSHQREKELIFKQLEIITGDEDTRYIIVPGDTLSIEYMDKSEKTGALYKVSAQGEIFLPLVGVVKVSGLSRQQARSLINNKLSEYFRKPQVNITVNAAGRIMVLGKVNLPGLYSTQPNLTVMEAILKAGSYDQDDANLRSVIVIRGGVGAPEIMRLNLLKMITKGDRTDDILVKPGDLIYLPKSFISNLIAFKDEAYKWVNTYYSFGRLPAPPPVEKNTPVLYERGF